MIDNPNSSDGNKEAQSVDSEYPIVEGKRRLKIGSDNSEMPKSPLQ